MGGTGKETATRSKRAHAQMTGQRLTRIHSRLILPTWLLVPGRCMNLWGGFGHRQDWKIRRLAFDRHHSTLWTPARPLEWIVCFPCACRRAPAGRDNKRVSRIIGPAFPSILEASSTLQRLALGPWDQGPVPHRASDRPPLNSSKPYHDSFRSLISSSFHRMVFTSLPFQRVSWGTDLTF